MENQKTPFMNITVGKESMTDAFNIEKERYDTMHRLACDLLDGKVEGLFFNRTREDGQHERGLDIAAVINHIQDNALSLTELVLGAFFFGNGLGQIMQQVRDQQRGKSMEMFKQAITEAAKEAGYDTVETETIKSDSVSE